MTVKEIRSITGLSQAAFSSKYHIPLRTLQSWENGERKPAAYIVYLLEKVVKTEYNK